MLQEDPQLVAELVDLLRVALPEVQLDEPREQDHQSAVVAFR